MTSTGQQTRSNSDTGSGGRFKSPDTRPGAPKKGGKKWADSRKAPSKSTPRTRPA